MNHALPVIVVSRIRDSVLLTFVLVMIVFIT